MWSLDCGSVDPDIWYVVLLIFLMSAAAADRELGSDVTGYG